MRVVDRRWWARGGDSAEAGGDDRVRKPSVVEDLEQQIADKNAQLDGIKHGPDGSLDKLLMTWTEQSVGHAALATVGTGDQELFEAYLYSRAQSVMGGTSQIQKNIVATRILGLPDG